MGKPIQGLEKLTARFREAQVTALQSLVFDPEMPPGLLLRLGRLSVSYVRQANLKLRGTGLLHADSLSKSDIAHYELVKEASFMLLVELGASIGGIVLAASMENSQSTVIALCQLANECFEVCRDELILQEAAGQLTNIELGDQTLLDELKQYI